MNNFLKSKNNAVLEFEEILKNVGWQDGYGLNESWYTRDKSKPLFFRNSAPALDSKFEVEIQSNKRIIYLLYNIISAEFKTGTNRPYEGGTKIEIAVDIIYDDAFNFMEDASDQTTIDDKYMDFGSLVINKLIEKQWTISDLGETPIASEITENDYLNKMSLIISKYF